MGCKTRGEGSILVIPQNGFDIFFLLCLLSWQPLSSSSMTV